MNFIGQIREMENIDADSRFLDGILKLGKLSYVKRVISREKRTNRYAVELDKEFGENDVKKLLENFCLETYGISHKQSIGWTDAFLRDCSRKKYYSVTFIQPGFKYFQMVDWIYREDFNLGGNPNI
jgi:hypothetical protein